MTETDRDRLQTIMDEALGPYPTMTTEELLNELERRLRDINRRRESAVVKLHLAVQTLIERDAP